MSHYPIKSYVPRIQGNLINFRIETPFPNCKVDDILQYFTNPVKKMEYDVSVEYAHSVPVEIPMNSSLVYAKLKTIWPVGIRDFLMFTHVVKHKDECWFQGFSTKHQSCPVPKGMIRINIEETLVYFQP